MPVSRSLVAPLAAFSVLVSVAQSTEPTHTVVAGQTLWSIAYAHGVKVEDLARLNRLVDPAEIEEGRVLRLPAMDRVAPSDLGLSPGPTAVSLSWPVRGRITSRYGPRRRSRHTGLDIAAPRGTIIVAAAAGVVVRAGEKWGRYGNVVLVEHPGGYSTLYSHVVRGFVRNGDRVERGQAIAAIGQTGNATGPHLHFEVWIGDRTDDPLRYLADEMPRTAEIR